MKKPTINKLVSKWLNFANIIGNINMTILLSLIYFLLLTPMAIVFKLVSDPLRLKKPKTITWMVPQSFFNDVDNSMKNQF